MSKTQHKYLKSSVLLLLFSFSTLYSSIVNASRGSFVTVIFQLLLGYALFKEHISSKVRKIICVGGIALFSLIITVLVILTITRFSEVHWNADYDDPLSSAISYVGQSMLVFNDGLADSIQRYMWGDYFFGTNEELYKNGRDAVLGTHFGQAFYTFVGAIYIDIGPLFTFLLALLLPTLMGNMLKKKYLKISTLFVFLYFASFIASGVFVIGSSYFLPMFITFIVYFIIKRLE